MGISVVSAARVYWTSTEVPGLMVLLTIRVGRAVTRRKNVFSPCWVKIAEGVVYTGRHPGLP
jgi:hypothetical protein